MAIRAWTVDDRYHLAECVAPPAASRRVHVVMDTSDSCRDVVRAAWPELAARLRRTLAPADEIQLWTLGAATPAGDPIAASALPGVWPARIVDVAGGSWARETTRALHAHARARAGTHQILFITDGRVFDAPEVVREPGGVWIGVLTSGDPEAGTLLPDADCRSRLDAFDPAVLPVHAHTWRLGCSSPIDRGYRVVDSADPGGRLRAIVGWPLPLDPGATLRVAVEASAPPQFELAASGPGAGSVSSTSVAVHAPPPRWAAEAVDRMKGLRRIWDANALRALTAGSNLLCVCGRVASPEEIRRSLTCARCRRVLVLAGRALPGDFVDCPRWRLRFADGRWVDQPAEPDVCDGTFVARGDDLYLDLSKLG